MTYSHRFCGGYGFNAGLINAAGTWLHLSAPLSCGTLVLSPNTISLGGTPWVSLLAMCVRDPCPGTVESSEFAAMQSVTVWVSDSTAPGLRITGGSATTPGWKRGLIDLAYQASDNTGIAYADVTSGAVVLDQRRTQCNQTVPAPCPNQTGGFALDTTHLPDGAQTVLLRAQDTANNWASATIPVNIDNTAPSGPLELGVVGGEGWRQSNSFSLIWRNPSQAGNAPIAAVNYAVCPAQSVSSDWTDCTFGERTVSHVAALDGLSVPRAGEWTVRVWLRDAAGNENRDTAQAVSVKAR